MNHTTRFTNVWLVKLLVFAPLFNAPKKHDLTILYLKWLHLVLLEGGTAENRKRVVEGRGFFPHVLIYLECQKNTLSESEHILTLICAALGRFRWSL